MTKKETFKFIVQIIASVATANGAGRHELCRRVEMKKG